MKKIISIILLTAILACVGCTKVAPDGDNNSQNAGVGKEDISHGATVYGSTITVKGYYLEGKTTNLIVELNGGGPVEMNAQVEDLSDGDLIEIVCDPIKESYPGQTNVYAITKLEEGTIDNIDEGTLDQLREMGWID